MPSKKQCLTNKGNLKLNFQQTKYKLLLSLLKFRKIRNISIKLIQMRKTVFIPDFKVHHGDSDEVDD